MQDLLIILVRMVAHAALILGAVVVGYWMGFKAALPDTKLIERKFDPGPQPDEDIWRDALRGTEEEKEERIATI